jgi:CspA family cold shock protein
MSGTVAWFNHSRGYGFIRPDSGVKDVFVHISALHSAGLSGLAEGQRVTFDIDGERDGRAAAVNITLVTDAPKVA